MKTTLFIIVTAFICYVYNYLGIIAYIMPQILSFYQWILSHLLSLVALTIGSLSLFLPVYYYFSLKPKIDVFFGGIEYTREIEVKVAVQNEDKMLCLNNRGKKDITIEKVCILYPIKRIRFHKHPKYSGPSGFLFFHEEEFEYISGLCYFPVVPSTMPPFSKKPLTVCYPISFVVLETGTHEIKVIADVQISEFVLGLASIFSRRKTYRIRNTLTIKTS